MSAPLFSIVTPVYDPPLDVLQDTIDSVRRQSCGDWEWILVDDCSPEERVREVLRAAAAADPRIRVIERETNGHIVEASNDGVDAARGEFIVLLDHDDLLTRRALQFVQEAIEGEPEVDYLYSDEDKVDAEGRYYQAFHKPDWSPERLRGQMYTSHLGVLRTSLVREVGRFRHGYDGSQDHDLVLRVTERARAVVHVPRVLYHWRVVPGSAAGDAEAKPYAWTAGLRAVQDQLDRLGIDGTADYGRLPGTYAINRRLDPAIRVSVVIPTRGDEGLIWGRRRSFVVEAVRSLVAKGGHENLEVVVVHDGATPDEALDEIVRIAPDTVLVPYAKPFNFSEKCNLGAVSSHGDVIVLLNDDVEIESEGFVPNLVAPLLEDGVGMTGARLLFADTTMQHAGLTFDQHDLTHVFAGATTEDPGPFAALLVNREVSGLTGACVALTRDTYEDIGGLSEQLPVNFNDVDLSIKVTSAGLRLVWVANAVAFHFESQTRVPVVQPWEALVVLGRWQVGELDPYLPGESMRTAERKRQARLARRRS